MSARRILRAFDRQPAGRFEIDQRVLPGRSQVFLPSLGYSGVLYGGSGGSPIVTLQNANAPFTQESVRGGRAHVYRPNTGTIAGESYKWQTPDFDIGANGSMFWYGYRDTDSFSVALEYGGANWGLTLENTGTQVKASYVDNPTTAAFTATLTQASSTSEPIAIGLIKNGATVTVVCRGASASTSGGNGGIRRSAGSGFGVEYQIGQAYSAAFLAGVTSEALSVSAMQALLDNPWSVFRANSRTYFIPSAGGGGATITGDSGSYTLTGTAATLKAGRKLAADSGTYNLTGTAAALKVGRKLTADSGTYTLTGTAVAFKRGYALGAESGTYTVSGTSVNLKAGRKLTADSGSYALTGTDVTLNYSPAGSYNLTAESGTYTLTGTAATLKVSRKLTADSGTYALTGTAAGLAKGVRLTAESGSYTLTGSNVAFARTYVLTAESGAYTLTGTSAGLTWSGAPVVEVPTNGGPSIYGKPVFREKQFRKEYEEQVKRIEDEKRLARILREDEEIICIMALMAA